MTRTNAAGCRSGSVLLALLCGCPSAALPSTSPIDPLGTERDETCVLERWEDGDTAYVDCGSGIAQPVRLLDIDAAESGFDDNSRRRAEWQAQLWGLPVATVLRCGQAATARVKEICPEESQVELHGDTYDKYDRRLAHVRCRGLHVNVRLIEEGHAGRYPYPADPQRPRACR